MSGWMKFAFVLAALVIADGIVCLIFRKNIRPMVRSYLPGIDLIKIALAEIAVGLSAIAVILWLA